MSQEAGLWLVVAIGFAAANLPFVNDRVFGLLPYARVRSAIKPFWFRAIELLLLYGLSLVLGRAIEGRFGPASPQEWQFYAVTACLFVVAAYPGFVFRYLRRKPQQGA
ncbi:DUF2818 family protein [Derxia gummosa]|uniref:DUF2818 family protein n=1 Tax=Derxia gummosa DSM 723 TaxID=1121388 RepID=A0A8B6X204_9BURK|nr:DUF2818 family protein [Derxia gummosa]